MNRREFLTAVSTALASFAIPTIGDSEVIEGAFDNSFNPEFSYGQFVFVSGNDPFIAAKEIMRSARSVLPKGTPFMLLAKQPDDLWDGDSSLAWKYTPRLKFGDMGIFIA